MHSFSYLCEWWASVAFPLSRLHAGEEVTWKSCWGTQNVQKHRSKNSKLKQGNVALRWVFQNWCGELFTLIILPFIATATSRGGGGQWWMDCGDTPIIKRNQGRNFLHLGQVGLPQQGWNSIYIHIYLILPSGKHLSQTSLNESRSQCWINSTSELVPGKKKKNLIPTLLVLFVCTVCVCTSAWRLLEWQPMNDWRVYLLLYHLTLSISSFPAYVLRNCFY